MIFSCMIANIHFLPPVPVRLTSRRAQCTPLQPHTRTRTPASWWLAGRPGAVQESCATIYCNDAMILILFTSSMHGCKVRRFFSHISLHAHTGRSKGEVSVLPEKTKSASSAKFVPLHFTPASTCSQPEHHSGKNRGGSSTATKGWRLWNLTRGSPRLILRIVNNWWMRTVGFMWSLYG
jgi:hypothetical protein